MAATWATSSVRSSAISAKKAGFVSGPFRFRSHSQAGVSSERIHLSCGFGFETTAWTRKYCSVCQHLWSVKSSTSIPALRAWLLSRSLFGILFSLINGRVLLERVSLNFASPGLSIVNWTLHKRKRLASNPAHQPGRLVFSLLKGRIRLPAWNTGSNWDDFQHLAFKVRFAQKR